MLPPSSSLALGLQQEPRLSLGGQHCAGEPDEELAGAFPLFIRNAVLGQKQAKRARAEPRRSTDAVSVPPAGARPAHGPPTACRSSLLFTSGQNRLRWPWGPDQVHPACILVLWPWAELSPEAHTLPHLYPKPQPARGCCPRCAEPDLTEYSSQPTPSLSLSCLRSRPPSAFALTSPSDRHNYDPPLAGEAQAQGQG